MSKNAHQFAHLTKLKATASTGKLIATVFGTANELYYDLLSAKRFNDHKCILC